MNNQNIHENVLTRENKLTLLGLDSNYNINQIDDNIFDKLYNNYIKKF